ncbi:MAG: hypothetical protein WBQ95_12150 [Terracidiphilus sp.]
MESGIHQDSDQDQCDREPVKGKNAEQSTDIELAPIGLSAAAQKLGVEEVSSDHEEKGDAKSAQQDIEPGPGVGPGSGSEQRMVNRGVIEEDA